MPTLKLLRRLHADERGAVTLETVLIIGAVALPILIFVLKFGWPRVRNYFNKGVTKLQEEGTDVTSGVSNN
jgi:Flp pilus assembly pilin Flp